MKPTLKLSIIFQFKNCFKKGVVALVVVMLLTIPKLHVYSEIGNYKTFSPAIAANNKHESLSKMGDHLAYPAAVLAVGFFGIVAGVSAFIGGTICTVGAVALANRNKGGSIPSPVDANYSRYDLSQFDN